MNIFKTSIQTTRKEEKIYQKYEDVWLISNIDDDPAVEELTVKETLLTGLHHIVI